jgi:hypothetical protein
MTVTSVAFVIAFLMQSGEAPPRGAAGSPPASVSPEQETQGSIAGHVFSALTGEPLRNASVQLSTLAGSRLETRATRSAPDGSFVFEHLRAGTYGVFVEKAGYEPKGLPAPLRIEKNQARADIEIKINQSAAIAGRITDRENLPVAGAAVHAFVLRWRNGRQILVRAASVTTDERGIYRLSGLAPGRYLLGASVPADEAPQGELDLAVSRVFYPMAVRASEAAALKVAYGQELAEVNLALRREQTFSVSGVVADGGRGGPCSACTIRAASLEEPPGFSPQRRTVAPDGGYRVCGLVPGRYRITAEKNLGGRRLVSSQIVQVTNRDIQDVRLLAGVERGVKGRVIFEAKPAESRLDQPQRELSVVLTTLDGVEPAESDRVTPEGAFQVFGLSSETYRVRLDGLPEGAFLKTVRLAGRDVPAPEVEVGESGSSGALDLVVSFESATLAGRVRPAETDAQAIMATVILAPAADESAYLTTLRAGAHPDGRFTLNAIPPGAYTAFAVPRNSRLDWDDPDIQRQMQDCGKRVELRSNKQQALELPLCPEPTQ